MQLAMKSLGLSDMGRLYEIYAAHIVFERGIRNDTPMYLSDKFIGTNLKDAWKAEIMQTHLLGSGSHFYLNSQLEAFARYKEITRIEASAVNHSIPNIQSEQSASYSAEVSLSAESDQRSASSESPKTFKRRKGLTSINLT
ncbi:hypothetical protein BY996DRAFT_6416460 [Phakopsora pachyrhizi]|nr:hypothetical protein BY996DRAFT_6416460 [Phakopsora pachyrhizi]